MLDCKILILYSPNLIIEKCWDILTVRFKHCSGQGKNIQAVVDERGKLNIKDITKNELSIVVIRILKSMRHVKNRYAITTRKLR